MIPDNGPKDGDFASYVEGLSRASLERLAPQERNASSDLVGDAQNAYAQASDESSADIDEAVDARNKRTAAHVPHAASLMSSPTMVTPSQRAVHLDTMGQGFDPARTARPVKPVDVLQQLLNTPALARDGKGPLRQFKFGLRVFATLLIAYGIFGASVAIVPILVGVFLLSISFQSSKKKR